ncbi:MAG: hypothetical protein ACFCGT_11200 [Sandaracinaceae bacterium]
MLSRREAQSELDRDDRHPDPCSLLDVEQREGPFRELPGAQRMLVGDGPRVAEELLARLVGEPELQGPGG